MSVADKLGTGTSFGNVPRGRSARGRAKAIAQGDVPAYELVRLHLDEVSPTPLNPRRNFGTDEDKTRFGEELRQVQLAACVAVTRDAYLSLWPDHAERIGTAQHVLVNGERRYHSAVHVGLDALDFVVRDDLASSREEFVNHLLKENLEREDFDVIERARGVKELVDTCAEQSAKGARARAATRLGKDRSWVTNQLALLDLPTEIQAMLSSGDMPERDGRTLARHCKEHPELGAADLIAHLKALKEAEAQKKAEQKAILQAAQQTNAGAPGGSVLSADNTTAEPAAAAQAPDPTLSADNKPIPAPGSAPRAGRSSAATDSVLSTDNTRTEVAGPAPSGAPAPDPVLSADNTPESVPHQTRPSSVNSPRWDDPLWVDRQVRKHMSAENRDRLVWLLQAEDEGEGNH
ncbi:ParB/RepB/Spo0J family partition protein [Streptomyces longispororuber]|uniref:ParB/RepB/Spo0J family partition protein n=1 Tax=Streptomyces longispororuber TaxID=68230 RepID=UPI0034032BCE